MPEAVTEKEICSKCGAEVRAGTLYCYSCGGPVAAEDAPRVNGSVKPADDPAQAALEDLAQKLKGGDKPVATNKTVAKAAEERKKARVTQRKTRDFVWEPHNETPWGLLIAVFVVLVAAVLTVLVTVVWK